MLFNPSLLRLIRTPFAKIDDIRTRVDVPGLIEVNVRIDQTRDRPLPTGVEDLLRRNPHRSPPTDIANASPFDNDRAIADSGPSIHVDNIYVVDHKKIRGLLCSEKTDSSNDPDKCKFLHGCRDFKRLIFVRA